MDSHLAAEGWKEKLLEKGGKFIYRSLKMGKNISIGANTLIVGDHIEIGTGCNIAADCQIKSAHINIGDDTEIGKNTQVLCADKFIVGPVSRISRGASITCRSFSAGRFLYFGHECTIGYGGTMESTSNVQIGNNVALGPHNILNANCGITLGDKVGSGSYVTFWTHGFHFGHSILDGFGASFEPIHIHNNVWLGYHVTVLPGINIGENTIIAAGAVVSKNIAADMLAGGVPAKPIKSLKSNKLPQADADLYLNQLFDQWRAEIQWKGLQVSEVEKTPGVEKGYKIISAGSEISSTVYLLKSPLSTKPSFEEATILITLEDLASLRTNLLPTQTLFEIRSGLFTGRSTPLAEDLRDYFRRRTLVCGDDRLFSAITPQVFDRLKAIK